MANGLKNIKTIRDFAIEGKTVFLRLDLNVPLENGVISDETRITASLPTVKYCMENGAKVVMASHLGRPKSADDKEFSLEPVAKRMSELLNADVILAEDPTSDGIKHILMGLKKNQLVLLENSCFTSNDSAKRNWFSD